MYNAGLAVIGSKWKEIRTRQGVLIDVLFSLYYTFVIDTIDTQYLYTRIHLYSNNHTSVQFINELKDKEKCLGERTVNISLFHTKYLLYKCRSHNLKNRSSTT